MRKFLIITSLFFAITTSNNASAQNFIEEFKAWGVFSIIQEGEKVCYMTSTPSNKRGNYSKRGEPYMLVTYRQSGVSEVSLNSGYPFKSGSDVAVRIDNRHNYSFFTSKETPEMAWAKDSKTDKQVVKRLKAGNNLTAKGYSRKGTYSLDTYSLSGFTAAYKKMVNSCK